MANVVQLIWNGIGTGSVLAIAAVGLTLSIGIVKFLNIAYGEYLTLGAYFAFAANVQLGLSLPVSIVIGMLVMGAGAVVIHRTVFKQFDSRSASTLLVVSIGLAFILRNGIVLIWGPNPRRYDIPVTVAPRFHGIYFLPEQLAAVGISVLTLLILYYILRKTRVGIAMRAASDDLHLTQLRGVDTDRLVFYVWLLAGAIAGMAGSLLVVQTQLNATIGFSILLSLFAAVIIGGIGSPLGAVFGGYMIGIAEELSLLILPPEYKTVVGMIVLVLAIIFKPEGLFGAQT